MAGENGKQAIHYIDGAWHEGNPAVMGPMTHGFWMSSVVFDGARAFEGVAPDLDWHCRRVIESARGMGLGPSIEPKAIETLAREGIGKFDPDAALYIRPVFYADGGFVAPDPATTRFILSIFEAPMPDPTNGLTACLARRTRPGPLAAPTHAKASCLYPNAALALNEAKAKGFENAVMCDPLGNVAEFATANLFLAKDGVIKTPAANGTFLNGITRQRMIMLMRAAGLTVLETRVTVEELMTADEIFSTGNYSKILPVTRYEDRDLQPGPMAREARRLYWEFAHNTETQAPQAAQ